MAWASLNLAITLFLLYRAWSEGQAKLIEEPPSSGHIQAVGIPQQAEKLIVFKDRGRVYTVGMDTGKIRYVDAKTKE